MKFRERTNTSPQETLRPHRSIAFVVGIALAIGIMWATGIIGGNSQPETQPQETEQTETIEPDTGEEGAQNSAGEESTPEEETPAAQFTLDTAREACNAELEQRFSGVQVNWDDQRSVQKQEGDAWFFKAPATGGSHPGERWAKCKVSGTPQAPEWYVVRLD